MQIRGRAKTGEFEFSCNDGERILYAGLGGGVPLPYECATGTCGTCRARLASGDIRELWSQAPGHKYVKSDKNEFLMCQAVALTDCEILVPGKIPLEQKQQTRRFLSGRLSRPVRCTHDVATFDVNLSEPIRFHAGQFVVIRVPHIEGYRAYSMTNYAQETDCLRFVIKKFPGGNFSEWLFASGNDGAEVDVFGPLGTATLTEADNQNIVCIAGGSGIAGMMSILAWAKDSGYWERNQGQVFFGVRTLKDRFFVDELREMAATFADALHITVALSHEQGEVVPEAGDPLVYESGMVHEVAGAHLAAQDDDFLTFIAGPPPMVDGAIRMLLVKYRIPSHRIRYDKFS